MSLIPSGVARLAAVAGFLVIWSAVSAAASPSTCGRMLGVATAQSEAAVENAITQLLRFRISEAERTLAPLRSAPDAAPAAHHLLAMSAFLMGLVTDQDADFDRFSVHADAVDRLLQNAPATCWTDYLRAETELQRAVVAVKQEKYLSAAWHGRAAYKRYERAAERYPGFLELYKGLGLMHLGIGALPGTWRRFLRILGYSGSVQQGLVELERATGGGLVSIDPARLSQGLALLSLGIDSERAVFLLREVHDRHPDSPFFGYLYGFALLETRRAGEAEAILRRYAGQRGDGVHQYIDFVDFYLGRALFVQDRYDEAERHLSRYVSTHEGNSLMAAAHLFLGMSREMQGNVQAAHAQYRIVQAARDYDIDDAARREARRRLATPLQGIRRTLLLGANALDSGRYERAAALLHEVLSMDGVSAAEHVEALYRLARVHHVRGDAEGALTGYHRVIEAPRDPETKWAPWAQLYTAELLAGQGREDEAIRAYHDALDYPGPYDYQQSLEQNARAALEVLRAKR